MQSSRNIKLGPLVARAWSVEECCRSWKGCQHAYGGKALWTGQVVRLATLLGDSLKNSSIQAAAGCARTASRHVQYSTSAASNEGNKRERQDLLGRTSFHDHTRWLDFRHLKKNPCWPHFGYQESGKALWFEKYHPAWMDYGAPAPSPWSLSTGTAEQLAGPGSEENFTPESVKILCQQGQVKAAVEVLGALVGMNSGIDRYLIYSVLKECVAQKDRVLGFQVHALAQKSGFGSDTFLCNHFIRMYAGHGKLQEAMDVFKGVALPDVFMWSSIISAHVKLGQPEPAIQLYQHMRALGKNPNGHVLVAALQACAAAEDLQSGIQVHNDVLATGTEHDMFVCNSLLDMYAKCGRVKDARRVFDSLGEKNVVSWSAMIAGYARVEGMGQEALALYSAMRCEGMVAPNAVTFVSLLQACANMGVSALEQGRQLHLYLTSRRLESDMAVGGSLVNMYVKCGSLKDARVVFDSLSEKGVATWNALLAGYAQQEGMGQEALRLYSAMHSEEGMVSPDAVTFICLLQACANSGVSALQQGMQLHSQLKDRRLQSHVVAGGSLVNMYVKCGSLRDARIVFDALGQKSVVTWNAMIAGYAQQRGMGQEALSLYSAMHSEQGMAAPDVVTFVCLLQACANVGVPALEKGKQLHSHLKEQRLESDVAVAGSLVNMYAKCGSLTDARKVFDGLRDKDVVTWTAMIAGYAQQKGMALEALKIYSAMRTEGMATPNEVTYVSLLEACASVGALQQGKQLHSQIRERGFERNALIGTCLVRMYAKCGSLEVSREVFDRLPVKDLVTWNALLKEYAEHGQGSMAIQCFEELAGCGIQPNEVTYTCLLTACSHAGLIEQGLHYFERMVKRHGVEPNEQLCCCMVDLLGRSGHLDRAERMLRTSGVAGNAVSWTALLSACKSHGDPELGRRCFDRLVELEPTDATAYLLLGSIYANAGRWDDVARVEGCRKAAGAKKKAAKACIEVRKEVHEFTVGEERSDVAATLRKMNTRVREGGHVPQTHLVLRAVTDQEREDALCGHAEKLALAYGLLHTAAGSTLVVTKNLRMCNDCHSSTKIMSHLEKREIVVRDGNKVHRFRNGACSCQDRH